MQSHFPVNIPENLSDCFPPRIEKGNYALIHPGSGSPAKIFSKNLMAVISLTVKDEVKHISEQRKFEYQINFAQALSKMKHSIVLLFIRPMEIVQTMVSKLQKIFIQTIERIRPGRKYKRNHKVKQKKFHFAYKTVC